MAKPVTRIQNNQIFDKTITYEKIADSTLVDTLFQTNTSIQNLTIRGNLSVIGNSSTISSTNTIIHDPIIVFNNGYTGAPSHDVGILINRNLNGGSGSYNTAWVWNEDLAGFEAIWTTETGGTVGLIDNSGFTNIKVGNLLAVTSSTIGNISLTDNTIATTNTNGNLSIVPNGSGQIVVSADVLPVVAHSLNLGAAIDPYLGVYADNLHINGALITTSNGDVTITPASGGTVTIANLAISGSSSTFTGNIVSGNVTITGGTIDGTLIGSTNAAAGIFSSIVDNGNLTANGSNATISLQPTGTGTVTIAPATTGSMNNVVIGATGAVAGTFTTVTATTETVTNLSSGNVTLTGGNISSVAISGGSISGTPADLTTLTATGNVAFSGATISVSGIETITNTTQSYTPADGALVVAGGVGVAKDVSVGGNIRVAQTTTLGTVTVNSTGIISSTGNITLSSSASVKIGALAMPQVDGTAGSFMMSDGAGNLSLVAASSAAAGNVIPLGTPTVGTLVDNNPAIVSFTAATKVTDAVDKLNEVLGKLVPPQPPAFPNATSISISSLSSGLFMTLNNPLNTGTHAVVAGTGISYRTVAAYTTNTITNVGPGSSGTVSVVKNGVTAGSRTMVETFPPLNDNTYVDLVISNNRDYSSTFSPARALLFWTSFNAAASGNAVPGWNDVYLTDTAGSATNTAVWYYDTSTPGAPVVTSTSFAPTTAVTTSSSGVPHYTSTTVWTGTGTAAKLSGALYPDSTTLVTGVAGGAFSAPGNVSYASAGVNLPLAYNLYVASGSGNASFTTTVNTVNATAVSAVGPSYSVYNGYATTTIAATTGGNVLTIKANDTTVVDENYIVVGSFGSGGSATAVRVGGLASGATPTTGSVTAWVSSAALATHEAAVVAGKATCNTTNYSTGYFPVGPNLATQASTQYITFRITKDTTSKFDVSLIGKISGCHIAMPGSGLDTKAGPTNGWIDLATSYDGSGAPGTGTGGNGSVGCALGGNLTVGAQATQSRTVTFGTESSHNSTGNYIYVRFTLVTGDNISALSFVAATHY